MNIKDKLARLDNAGRKPTPEPPQYERWKQEVEEELQAKIITEEKSFVFLKESYHPLSPDKTLCWLQERDFQVHHLHRICGSGANLENGINLRKTLFIDTETTGLAGGTGTYAFLIGIGHLELDHVVVRQYVLPDFQHEWLMLKLVEGALQGYELIVTFNGKSFDVPLLKNRYILNRMDSILEEIPHLDILHAARRIWKDHLPSCNLQTLESYVLNNNRIEDIPGSLIPQIYFEFIRKRDALMLRDVLEHNFHDIVNLALLTIHMAAIGEDPVQYLEHPKELFSLARYFHNTRQFEEMIPILEYLVQRYPGMEINTYRECLYYLANGYKKLGNSAQAKEYLTTLIERQIYHPLIVEELAKIYEHEEKDFGKAKEVVEKGIRYLETLQQLGGKSENLRFLPALNHRYNRLISKLSKV
ncbi:MAG: hypothetical protein D6748_01590 [Calditrichaeota bacterium]|nr:MAG: hypothetical protein D6748_01590 [Calditrichota bacterium]